MCSYLSAGDRVQCGALDAVGVLVELQVAQHHHGAQDKRRRVRNVATGDVGCRAVDLRAWRRTQYNT